MNNQEYKDFIELLVLCNEKIKESIVLSKRATEKMAEMLPLLRDMVIKN